jgi:cytochrome P450
MLFDPNGDYSSGGSPEVLARAVREGDAFIDERSDGRGKAATAYVLRYQTVRRLLSDADLTTRRPAPDFSHLPPRSRATLVRLRRLTRKWPLLSDGGYHARLRQHLTGTLQPLTAELTTRVQTRVRAVLRTPDRQFSWLREVAEPIATDVLGAMLGVPDKVAIDLAAHASVVADQFSTSQVDDRLAARAIDALTALEAWLVGQLPTGRTHFMHALGAIRDDPRLGLPAASATLAQAVTGGYDPIVSTLCVVAGRFRPELGATLSTTALAEELIRLTTPFRYAVRYNQAAREIGDLLVPAENRCVLGLATANLDETIFPDPLAVRSRHTGHLAFGFGKHYCLGASAARSVVRGVLEVLREEGVWFRSARVSHAPELGVLRFLEFDGEWVRGAAEPSDVLTAIQAARA